MPGINPGGNPDDKQGADIIPDTTMSFIKRLQVSLESLYHLPANARYIIAYSGGLDSHVLLHCCHQLKLPLRAVHVHHGLQDVADDWVKHCQSTCAQLSIPLDVFYGDAKPRQGLSPEEVARNVRYEAIIKNLQAGDCLLTAQHRNDQAETLLLQLFRTASAAGLAAMPAIRQLASAVHIRPLLDFSRDEIVEYATTKHLHWVEDPSNQDTAISRNFIRKEVLPILQRRWPEVIGQLSKVASLQSNNLQVLEDMAAIDLANLINTADPVLTGNVYNIVSILSVSGLKALSSARGLNVLRLWIIQQLKKQPSRKLLSEIERSLINSSQDAGAVIKYAGFEFRKFQDGLYLLQPGSTTNPQQSYNWVAEQTLEISPLNLKLTVQASADKGLSNRLLAETLTVSFRKGGERFHPAGRKHSQSLKKLLQEASIPPWERDFIPLVYRGDDLIAVGNLWLAKAFSTSGGEGGWYISLGICRT